jgi:hypothetical protein
LIPRGENLINTSLQRASARCGGRLHDFQPFQRFPAPAETATSLFESRSAASSRFFRRLSIGTTKHKIAHNPAAVAISIGFGEKIRMNPLSFTNAEKLDTQNGIKNSRNVCQKSNFTLFALAAVVLINNANPMIKLNPSEVSQSRSEESKYRTNTTQYQMK